MILREKINLSDLLGHNILLLNELAGSTFSNYETARKIIYENRIIPVFNTIIAGINSILKLPKGSEITADFSDIEALQADKKLKAEIDKTDKEIDQMVYELYGLSEEEIRIVEGV
jgi:phage portal protein BeeE